MSESFLSALPNPTAIATWHSGAIRFQQWNDKFARSFGLPAEEAEGRDAVPEHVERLNRELTSFALSGREISRFAVEWSTPLGIQSFDCTLAWIKETAPRKNAILVSAIDRTADRRAEESLRRELISDSLTSLPNRSGFGEALEEMIERHRSDLLTADAQVGVLLVDLLRFRRINEALGGMAGDELILSVASRLNALVGKDVVLGRIGSNDFGICHVFPNGVAGMMDLAQMVKSAFDTPIHLSDLTISVDCAIGCSMVPASMAEPDELIRRAQAASRVAKKTGQLEIYRPGDLGVASQRFFLESHLRDTLRKGGLHLVFQPIVDLATSQVTGFEALSRWKHDVLGVISPADFIPVAEESGLIVQLGRWAMFEAIDQLRQWDEKLGHRMPIRMNVNISPIQMVRDDVLKMVGDVLRLSGVDGDRLTVELTESAVISDPEKCAVLLDALKRSHVAVAMDDFGTGYSNMASLQSLSIDVLKIDRSFVAGMLVDHDKQEIVRAILSLAGALGMTTTAEGIEEAAIAEKLREMGCSHGQGYYFAKPMAPDDAFSYWLSRSASETTSSAI